MIPEPMRWIFLLIGCVGSMAVAKPLPDFRTSMKAKLRICMYNEDRSEADCLKSLRAEFRALPFSDPGPFLARLKKDSRWRNDLTPVPRARLGELAEKIKALPIDFRFEINGCYQRAALIEHYLETREGIRVGQIELRGDLAVPSRHLPLAGVSLGWGSHIAPVLLVQEEDGRLEFYSVDLTLFDEIRPLKTWLDFVTARTPTQVEIRYLPRSETQMDELQAFDDWLKTPFEPNLVNASSSLRTDLAEAFLEKALGGEYRISYPWLRSHFSMPEPLRTRFSPAVLAEFARRVRSELRCEPAARGSLLCGVLFRTTRPEFCGMTMNFLNGRFESDEIVWCHEEKR